MDTHKSDESGKREPDGLLVDLRGTYRNSKHAHPCTSRVGYCRNLRGSSAEVMKSGSTLNTSTTVCV